MRAHGLTRAYQDQKDENERGRASGRSENKTKYDEVKWLFLLRHVCILVSLLRASMKGGRIAGASERRAMHSRPDIRYTAVLRNIFDPKF